MSKQVSRVAATAACATVVGVAALVPLGGAPAPTRLLRQPTVSATHVAFSYANNIWSVDRKGASRGG